MSRLSIIAINIYQKYVSPHKGYRCAHHVLHDGGTCSQWMKSSIYEHGLMASVIPFRNRLHECRMASIKLNNEDSNNQDDSSQSKLDKEDAKDTAGCCLAIFPW